MVYVYTHELLAYSLDKKRGNHRGVNTARQSKQYLFVAYLRADCRNLFCDKLVRKFGSGDTSHCIGSEIRIHKNSSLKIISS